MSRPTSRRAPGCKRKKLWLEPRREAGLSHHIGVSNSTPSNNLDNKRLTTIICSNMTTWDEILKRIDTWGETLKRNEQATIQGIILPTLRLLGYDTENPEVVRPQETDRDGLRPDFAVYHGDGISQGAKFVIEAKPLTGVLRDYYQKVVLYMNSGTVRWYFLTNGREWELYDRNIPIPLENCRVAAFSIKDREAWNILTHLLSPNKEMPDVEAIKKVKIVAQLRSVINSVPWSTQKMAWDATGYLVKEVRSSAENLKREHPGLAGAIDSEIEQLVHRLDAVEAGAGTSTSRLVASETPRTLHELPSFEGNNWRQVFVELVNWAYMLDEARTIEYLSEPKPKGRIPRLFTAPHNDNSGDDLTRPLPNSERRFYVNYSVEALKKEMNRLASYFPSLIGKQVKVGQNSFTVTGQTE